MGVIIKVGNVEKDWLDKRPSEVFSITINYVSDLGSGASNTVTLYSVNGEDSSGASVTSTIISGISEATGVLTIGIKGGTAGQVYNIVSAVTSSTITPAGVSVSYNSKIELRVW